MRKFIISFFSTVLLIINAEGSPEARIKDLVEFQGARPNQLFGYGLVVGLNGTGDKTQTVFTSQSLMNMLDKLGIIPTKIAKFGLESSNNEMKVKNVAAVLVTAELGAFGKPGTRIDVTVSSIGDCKSLEGGTLVMTPLQGADGKIYAVAQGPLSIGGLLVSSPSISYPTVAHIPGGAYVERDVPVHLVHNNKIILGLRDPDFTSAGRIAEAINLKFNGVAKAIDGGSVEVTMLPKYLENTIGFLGELEQITVRDDILAKIIINERTGTIVTGENVKISSVAVSHGSLTVSIAPKKDNTKAAEDLGGAESKIMVLQDAVSIGQVAKGLSALGAKPSDMIAIFQAMKRAGALKAILEIM